MSAATTPVSYPGWDAHARQRVAAACGNLREAADRLDVDVADIPVERGHGMKVWSRIVAACGGTYQVLVDLGLEDEV